MTAEEPGVETSIAKQQLRFGGVLANVASRRSPTEIILAYAQTNASPAAAPFAAQGPKAVKLIGVFGMTIAVMDGHGTRYRVPLKGSVDHLCACYDKVGIEKPVVVTASSISKAVKANCTERMQSAISKLSVRVTRSRLQQYRQVLLSALKS